MRTELKKIVLGIALILCASLPVYADWQPSDGHKMHFPQLPNPTGWDIDLWQYELADDWQCSKTGDVNDIHFWISWKGDSPTQILNIQVKIYSNDSNIPSKPAQQLWAQTIYDFSIRLIDPNGRQGYWIPTGPNSPPQLFPNDHNSYYQVNIKNIQNAFPQVEGQIYWLSLKATVADSNKRVGWKTSLNHFMDAAVVRYTPGPQYRPLYEPNSTIPIDFAFVITGGPNEPNYQPENDLGDAPDSTNNFGAAMTAYPPLVVAANYPTVYLDPTGLPPYGPIHWQPRTAAWLGPWVTLENEADLFPPDEDGMANINPPANSPDHDANDDGVLNMPLVLRYCYPTNFQYRINVVNPAVGLYTNVWFDWNRDGDWDDTPIGCGNEWAVQNQSFPAGSLPVGLNTVTSSTFLPYHPTFNEAKIWMRITLSEQPWVSSGSGGSGPAMGYSYGETEDYFFTPDPNCLFVGRVFNVACGTGPAVNITITAAMINRWIWLGKPKCWCCDAQKCGNGVYNPAGTRNRVDAVDLAKLKLCFGKFYTQAGYDPCLDFNLSGRVDAVDLSILKAHFGQTVGSSCCF